MESYKKLLLANKAWVQDRLSADANYFEDMAKDQKPEFLWIGCSDSRVPAEEITGTDPGELFVHRNIANMVVHTDLNILSVLQYAVEVLKVKHIIVCGHYGCGGVRAALDQPGLGLIDNWLRHVEDVAARHHVELGRLPTDAARYDRLCELNAMSQALSVARTTFVRDAWAAGRPLSVHSWIYAVADGLLRDLKVTLTGQADLDTALEATTPIA